MLAPVIVIAPVPSLSVLLFEFTVVLKALELNVIEPVLWDITNPLLPVVNVAVLPLVVACIVSVELVVDDRVAPVAVIAPVPSFNVLLLELTVVLKVVPLSVTDPVL
jgi:hypothetical protein